MFYIVEALKRGFYVNMIIQRGNNKQRLFRDDEDFEKFLSLFGEYRPGYLYQGRYKSKLIETDSYLSLRSNK